MKGSDYIVEFLEKKGIKDVFLYPGGMITHLMESLSKSSINVHLNYHEQASALAACAYTQITRCPTVVLTTSGPGVTNMMTGLANAYYDSCPVVFITGQVNTDEMKKDFKVRQRGFQETDVVSMTRNITKFSKCVTESQQLSNFLEQAYTAATSGRFGPVILDIPLDVQRADTKVRKIIEKERNIRTNFNLDKALLQVKELLKRSKRPCFILGNGIKLDSATTICRKVINTYKIPAVTTMMGVDILPSVYPYNFGFLGAYGHRKANFILSKSDLVISVGARLDVRQVGANRDKFCENAQIIRVDIDENELDYLVSETEIQLKMGATDFLNFLLSDPILYESKSWLSVCKEIEENVNIDSKNNVDKIIERISDFARDDAIITTDVGQNQIWVPQNFKIKSKTEMLFSGGHGAMGYSLPASIGACIASSRPVISFSGDGGFQMNIQELEFIRKEKLPIKMVVLNNNALGMIRHFQEIYFDNNNPQTVLGNGYSAPSFKKVAESYGLKSVAVTDSSQITHDMINSDESLLIEVLINEDTYVAPRLKFGTPNQDQEPLLDRDIYNYLMSL